MEGHVSKRKTMALRQQGRKKLTDEGQYLQSFLIPLTEHLSLILQDWIAWHARESSSTGAPLCKSQRSVAVIVAKTFSYCRPDPEVGVVVVGHKVFSLFVQD